MSEAKSSGKKRVSDSQVSRTEKLKRVAVEDDFDLDLSSDINGIVSALKQIREKAHKDGLKKNEETISSLASEIKSMFDELKSKFEKERQTLAKALSKSSREYETSLKNEADKFKAVYEKICKEKEAHQQALKDYISKHEEEKERLFIRHEQLRKKEKCMLAEHEKACANKIAELEGSLKKKKQDDRTFSILRKTLSSFLGNASDEDFPHDD